MKKTRYQVGAALAKPALRSFKRQMDYTEYGGALLLGVNGGVVKAHGSSNAKAIKNAIRQARTFAQQGTVELIKEKLGQLSRDMKQNLKKTLLSAILAALVCVVTLAVRVPIPMTEGGIREPRRRGGLLGKLFGGNFLTAFALGAGSALADILAGAAIYAIPTFLVKTSMALLAMAIFKRSKTVRGIFWAAAWRGW